MKQIVTKNKSITAQMKRMLIIMSILFVLLCVFINSSMQKILLSNASEHAQITDEKLKNQLEFLYDKMDTFSMGIAEQEAVQELLYERMSQKVFYINEVEEMIAYYKIIDPEIVDISLVNKETHYTTVYKYEELDQFRQMNADRQYSWLGVRTSTIHSAANKNPMLIYAREVMKEGENVGTMIISIDTGSLQMDGIDEMNSYYMLAGEDGIIFPFNCTQETAQEIWGIWNDSGRQEGKDSFWYVRSRYLEKMECYQLSVLDLKEIGKNMSTIRTLIWFCVVLAVGFFLLFFALIVRNVVTPLRSFHGVIRAIRSKQQRGLKEELRLEGCTEISEIGEEFTGMMNDIECLNRKIFDTATDLYEMKVKKQEAELSYMRSQIDPHFLYNTLEVFRKKALEKDAPEIAQMAIDMGNIFRYSTKGEAVVTLEDEISIIKSYVRIQKNRFQGKIEVFYFLQEETKQVPVMKMLLQPLVENAIYHGLEPKEDNGNLYIGARIEEDELVVTVKDDGVGIVLEKLVEIQNLLEQDIYDTSRHVGILNTQARIRLQYGKAYGLSVESQPQDGTTITMRIPAR